MSRIATIDVGTNAMRCTIVETTENGLPRVLESVREPVRLGTSGFLSGSIGEPAASRAAVVYLKLDEEHAEKVRELSLELFDQLLDLHGLGPEEMTLLEAAALLHDVGLYLSSSHHHKHSYYLVSESDLVGLSRRQREVMANVVRYHRKRRPTTKHPHFEALGTTERETVRRLAAILRVADALDREQIQRVRAVTAVRDDDQVTLRVDTDGDLLLERWASTRKFRLFGEVFGIPGEIADE